MGTFDDSYLLIGGNQPAFFGGEANSNELQIYKFADNTLTAITSQDYGTTIYSAKWSSDGDHIAFGGSEPSNGNELWINATTYEAGSGGGDEGALNSVEAPAENGIILGNASLGSGYDLDIHVLSGARVELFGYMFHDPA